MPPTAPSPPGRRWSRDPITGGILLALALIPGAYFTWRIHVTTGLGAPRLWELLRDEPVFDLAMLDFALTAGWAALVLIERSATRGWRLWLSLAVFLAIPSVGIALALVLRTGEARSGEVA